MPQIADVFITNYTQSINNRIRTYRNLVEKYFWIKIKPKSRLRLIGKRQWQLDLFKKSLGYFLSPSNDSVHKWHYSKLSPEGSIQDEWYTSSNYTGLDSDEQKQQNQRTSNKNYTSLNTYLSSQILFVVSSDCLLLMSATLNSWYFMHKSKVTLKWFQKGPNGLPEKKEDKNVFRANPQHKGCESKLSIKGTGNVW